MAEFTYTSIFDTIATYFTQNTKIYIDHTWTYIDQAINLDNLLIQLKSAVTDKWYEFGEAIGVHREILEKYTQYPSDQSLIEILDHWLRNHSGQPTWNEISEGLTKINLLELALNIKSIYQTGIMILYICPKVVLIR